MIHLGRGGGAVDGLRDIHDRLSRRIGEGRYDTAETQGLLAVALLAAGNRRAAADAFGKAVPLLFSLTERIGSAGGTKSGRRLRLTAR